LDAVRWDDIETTRGASPAAMRGAGAPMAYRYAAGGHQNPVQEEPRTLDFLPAQPTADPADATAPDGSDVVMPATTDPNTARQPLKLEQDSAGNVESGVLNDANPEGFKEGDEYAQGRLFRGPGTRRGSSILPYKRNAQPRETPQKALESSAAEDARKEGPIAGLWPRDYRITKITDDTSTYFRSRDEAHAFAWSQLRKASNGREPVQIEPNKWRSRDGRWQYRTSHADEDKHFNLDRIDPDSGFVIRDNHLRF
jgi:hypothetical protein